MAVLSDEFKFVSVCHRPAGVGSSKTPPLGKSGGAGRLVVGPAGETALCVEVVVDGGMDGDELL